MSLPRVGQLPTSCPSCRSALRVTQLKCPGCATTVHGGYPLPALSRLGSEDQQFALAFLLRSGSLKQMARLYGVSYPTVRNRLDDVIAGLNRIAETEGKEPADDAAGSRAEGA